MDGEAGVAYPRETKLNKYFLLALSLAQLPAASQKQWQVACGGLVYLMSSWTLQDILDELRPGNAVSAQGRLFRLPLNPMPNRRWMNPRH